MQVALYLLPSSLFLVSVPAMAQEPPWLKGLDWLYSNQRPGSTSGPVVPAWSICGGYDVRTRNWIALTTGALRTKAHLFGAHSLSGELVWFTGSEVQNGRSTGSQGNLAGLGASIGWLIKGHVYLSASYGFGAFAGASPHGIPFGGLSLRF